eukprot:1187960-Prorocentrum_minimum.AAC.3
MCNRQCKAGGARGGWDAREGGHLIWVHHREQVLEGRAHPVLGVVPRPCAAPVPAPPLRGGA